MADTTIWWLLAGAAVAIELLTGTFYLLMLGIGMVAGALAAHAEVSQPAQLVAAALVGGGAVAGWHFIRRRHFAPNAPGANTNLDLDAGEPVTVDAWLADNTASVRYRGALWMAVPAEGTPRGVGLHRVHHVDGTRLVLEKI
jgi:membrane protein implicated in regulation of membrane protease activity